ncbi:MAG TPA: riboflavin synthase [Longimicrobiaceae bacterium]|nr:riboflavin synthase [Longimicrobiaceae bacterium]
MFTGIVEAVGTVTEVRPEGSGRVFTVRAAEVLDGLKEGDSIAIDGACQTVVALAGDAFTVQAVGTTLERTTLGSFAPGRRVNLERAVRVGDRLGGHLVQGHVDGVGRVTAVRPRGELVLIDFTLPEEVAPATVLHGSVTLDGVSLTVNALPAPGVCQVSIIPFTRRHTTVGGLREGDAVNVEGDMIGKYVRRLLGAPAAGGIDEHLLKAWGY